VSLTDDSTREIRGIGRIDLKMTFRIILTLQGVLHAPSLWRNLINESSLLRVSYMIVKKSNKFVISKSNTFIGKSFVCGGHFVINPSDNEIFIPVALNIESCDIWHGRLGHVNFNSIKKMINLNFIPKSSFDTSSRYEICVHGKNTQKIFPSITRTSEPLELIHSDVCNSNKVLN